MSNLRLGKSTQSQLNPNSIQTQSNEKAATFTQSAPVQTSTQTQPVEAVEAEASNAEAAVEEKATSKKKTKNEEPKIAPWRQGVNIDPKDLKLIQRPFNNNISQENYMRLVWLKGLGSLGFGANKDTFASMLDEAIAEYTARRIKSLGDNYDI